MKTIQMQTVSISFEHIDDGNLPSNPQGQTNIVVTGKTTTRLRCFKNETFSADALMHVIQQACEQVQD